MKHALETEDCPLDANLEKVMPGVHQWHQVTNDSINNLNKCVKDFQGEVKGELENLLSIIMIAKEDSKHDLARVCMSIAMQLMQGGPGDSNAVNMSNLQNMLLTMPQPTGTRSPQASNTTTDPTTVTGAATTTTTQEDSTDPADLDCNRLFRMKPKHTSLSALMKEWFGLDEFYDGHGGIQGRIDKYKSTTKWRKKCMIHPQHFSRTMRTVKAVEEFARQQGIGEMAAAAKLEENFAACEKSSANFVTWAQQQGLLTKRASRGKTSSGSAGGEE